MSRHVVVIVLLFSFVLLSSPAFARRYGSRSGSRGGGGGTAYSSMASGMGNLIRAQGAYNQMTAQAMIALEQAKSAALANKLKAAQTYYQLRRLNETEQAEEERKRLALYAPAPPLKTPRLTASQLDPVTGQITWVPVLLTPEYQPERTQLEHLFAERAADASHVTNTQVENLVDSMRDKLDAQIDKLTSSDFFAARHFLEAIAAETRYTGLESHPDAETSAAK